MRGRPHRRRVPRKRGDGAAQRSVQPLPRPALPLDLLQQLRRPPVQLSSQQAERRVALPRGRQAGADAELRGVQLGVGHVWTGGGRSVGVDAGPNHEGEADPSHWSGQAGADPAAERGDASGRRRRNRAEAAHEGAPEAAKDTRAGPWAGGARGRLRLLAADVRPAARRVGQRRRLRGPRPTRELKRDGATGRPDGVQRVVRRQVGHAAARGPDQTHARLDPSRLGRAAGRHLQDDASWPKAESQAPRPELGREALVRRGAAVGRCRGFNSAASLRRVRHSR
mmetsp:Transcript_20401/g.78404  ORF Transcript_20401/g.78404 Transcript_20401/m.78404 type:complete len:282 (-) Transcript_20401:92-937(-)